MQDIAGVDLQHKAMSSTAMAESGDDQPTNVSRIHHSNSSGAHHNHHYSLGSSPTSNGSHVNGPIPSSIDLTIEENGKMDCQDSPHLNCLTSPLVADLPLVSMRSPPLSLELSVSDVCKTVEQSTKPMSVCGCINLNIQGSMDFSTV